MYMNDYLSPEGLYRQGMQHFNHGEWQKAVDVFSRLEETDDPFPGVQELLADARIKLHLEGADAPTPLAPPRGPLLMRIVVGLVLCIILGGGGVGAYMFLPATPPPTAAMAQMVPVVLPPTATATPEPTAAPPAPTATAAPEPAADGIVAIKAAEDEPLIETPKNIEIIVDASGSMFAQMDGTDKQRWQVAQDAMMSLIQSNTISPDTYVALRTYGRRKGQDCGDLELAQPLKRFRGDALAGVVVGIKPTVGGMTPLAASLREAATDLQAAEGSTVIILVTDGLESCNGDPVAETANFVKDNPQRKVHVIGFSIDDQQASDKLREIAVKGNGQYFDATNATELAAAMRQTIVLGYHILASDGTEVNSGTVGQGDPFQLAPGTYKLRIDANPPINEDLIVDAGAHVTVELRRGYGGLLADVKTESP